MKSIQSGKTFFTISVIALILLLLSGTASAHKFFVTAWVEEDSVFLEAAFGDGRFAKNSEVVVLDSAGNILLNGATTELGEFNFKVKQKTEMTIKVKAGMGHQAEAIISLEEAEMAYDEYQKSAGTSTTSTPEAVKDTGKAPATAAAQAVPQTGAAPAIATAAVVGLSADEMSRIVEKAVDKKLRPLLKKLAQGEKSEKPKMKDILGGIGYIFGLVGVGTYFNYRRKQ